MESSPPPKVSMCRVLVMKAPGRLVISLTHSVVMYLSYFVLATLRSSFLALAPGYLDNAGVGVDLDPIAGLDRFQRVLIKAGHGRGAGDHGDQGGLGGHLVEDERLRGRAGQAGPVEHA